MTKTQTNLISCFMCNGTGQNYSFGCCGNWVDGGCCEKELAIVTECPACKGSGLRKALPKWEDVDITIDNDKENPF